MDSYIKQQALLYLKSDIYQLVSETPVIIKDKFFFNSFTFSGYDPASFFLPTHLQFNPEPWCIYRSDSSAV